MNSVFRIFPVLCIIGILNSCGSNRASTSSLSPSPSPLPTSSPIPFPSPSPASSLSTSSSLSPRTGGGDANGSKAPWIDNAVQIVLSNGHRCAGFVASDHGIITAKHCIDFAARIIPTHLFFSDASSRTVVPGGRGIAYNTYPGIDHEDVAWIRFQGDLPPSYQKVPLALNPARYLIPGTPFSFTGNASGLFSESKLTVPTDITNILAGYQTVLNTPGMVLAGKGAFTLNDVKGNFLFTRGKQVNSGDSGGPLYFRMGNRWVCLGVLSGDPSLNTVVGIPRPDEVGLFTSFSSQTVFSPMLPSIFNWLTAEFAKFGETFEALQGLALVTMTLAELNAYIPVAIDHYAHDLKLAGTPPVAARTQAEAYFRALKLQGVDQPHFFPMQIVDQDHHKNIGILVYELQGTSNVYIHDFEIEPAFRGKGHSKIALALLEQHARDLGRNSIHLHVFNHSTEATQLYRKMGYAQTGTNGTQGILMRKDL